MTKQISDIQRYEVEFEVETLQFYIDAFKYYSDLLQERLKLISENHLASKLFDEKDLAKTPAYQEYHKAQSFIEMLQKKIDKPDWEAVGGGRIPTWRELTIEHRHVRYIKSVVELYLKYLRNERNTFARKSQVSEAELKMLDARIGDRDKKNKLGVFEDADLVDLLVDVPEVESEKHDPVVLLSEIFVDLETIEQLRAIKSGKYNLSKLVRLCEELNQCYGSECYYAVAMLVRTILNHVPPIFGFTSFSEVANNYSGGGASFGKCMKHLEESSRRIADSYAHQTVRDKEVLPNKTQVNFSSDLAFLLSEAVRILP